MPRLRSKKGGANSCPYWDVCPSQAMARESLTSDVVVTTPTGFATMIVGRERKAFFEEALQQFDVVLFDEADRVQAQLDDCFAPSMSFQELIRNAADPTAVAMKRRPDDKMRTSTRSFSTTCARNPSPSRRRCSNPSGTTAWRNGASSRTRRSRRSRF